MKKFPFILRFLAAVWVTTLLTGCSAGVRVLEGGTKKTGEIAGTDETSHSKDAEPDYEVVFPQNSVNRIDITLTPEAWGDLQSEMTDLFGEFGTGGGMGRGFPEQPGLDGNWPTPDVPAGGEPPVDDRKFGPPGGNIGGGLNFADTSYVSGTVFFNGQTWEHVGFRYSGNSTLQNSWSSGTQKISFRLDFDEFEDEYPETTDQRFYGFKQISFKSNAMDDSYIREKVVSDIFRDAGVISSQTAFYEVYIDHGEGPQYLGLYTAVEIVDDTLIKTQFSDYSGNVYKPEGQGAAFIEGTFTQESFEKQTNEDEADWSDIEALFAALNSSLRTSDPAAWRTGLEAVFDVDAFIHWLAVDTIIQNWDTYGEMAHNYYLYNDPSDGLLTWIPWDNNMALNAQAMRGDRAGAVEPGGGVVAREDFGGRGGMGRQGVRELDLADVGADWPLIRFLMDDPVYLAEYQQYLQETIDTVWIPERLAEKYQQAHNLIAPYVEAETEGFTQLSSIESFNRSINALVEHANQRYKAVQEYLAAQ